MSELEQKERLEEFAGEKKHEPMGEIVSTFQEGPDSAPQTELFPEVQAELIPETKEKKTAARLHWQNSICFSME